VEAYHHVFMHFYVAAKEFRKMEIDKAKIRAPEE
jgi:hypothetical protein